jgi:hypothetical protein
MSTPKDQPPATRLSLTPEGLIYTGETLTYRINGLTAHNLDRIYVTLRAASPAESSVFHIDKLDLYNSRARESFAETCVKYLKVQQGAVMAELSQLITALEAERIAMRERGETQKVPPMSEQEKKESLDALKSKDLFKIILSGFDAMGYIGEKKNKLIGYLSSVSRLQQQPLAVLFLSRPGAGKTSLQDAICKLVPPEAVIQYTRVTGQALFYRESNGLKHRVLAIEEKDGLKEAMYSVKTLVTSQRLSISSTRTDNKTGKFASDDYIVTGPVVVMVSTTDPEGLDDETRGRFLTLTIDESDEQTKKILQAQITKHTLEWYQNSTDETAFFRFYHNLQRMLKPLIVVFPRDLKIFWPFGRLQMRREQQKFLSLVQAIVLLHQHQRKCSTIKRLDGSKMEYVEATQRDVDTALELSRETFASNIDDVSPMGRRLLAAIIGLVKEKYDSLKEMDPKKEILMSEIPFTRKELRERIGWSEAQVRRNLDHLVELGYIGRISGRQGSTFRYVLLDDGSADPEIIFGNQDDPDGDKPKDPKTKNQ